MLKQLGRFLLLTIVMGSACTKAVKDGREPGNKPVVDVIDPGFSVNLAPQWTTGNPVFLSNGVQAFEARAVKDPSVVYDGGLYHVFNTGRDKGEGGQWKTAYVATPDLTNLIGSGPRTLLTSLNGGGYFCAPQVFWFEPQEKWYLIYQSGQGPTFSTTKTVDVPASWAAGKGMGFNDGIDFWCISDGKDSMYCFYAAMDGSRTIRRRATHVNSFPYGWSAYQVVADSTFEAVHVYRNKPDGKYYMMVEDLARHFELWRADKPGGKWTKLVEKWAAKNNLTETGVHWTDQVSHGEMIRSGVNERLEIENINRCTILIQGVVNGNYGDYGNIPYVLGIIKNY